VTKLTAKSQGSGVLPQDKAAESPDTRRLSTDWLNVPADSDTVSCDILRVLTDKGVMSRSKQPLPMNSVYLSDGKVSLFEGWIVLS
jgi:hypothetical protein